MSGAIIAVPPEAKRLKMEDATKSPMATDNKESSSESYRFDITILPDELKSRVAQFLGAKDALSFAASCKMLHESLSLSCLQPSIVFENLVAWSGDSRNGDIPRKYRRIPILFQSRIHSVVVTLQWRDQGWGNLMGQIYVVATREKDKPTVSKKTSTTTAGTEESPPDVPFSGGRLVYESPVAPHTEAPLRFDFSPKPGETYYLWSKMGGGGGHMLSLRNVRIQWLVQADAGQHLRRTYSALHQHSVLELTALRPSSPDLMTGHAPAPLGVSTFYMNLLLQVARSLLTQLQDNHPLDMGLSTYLTTNGIDVHADSLAAVIEIVTTVLEEHRKRTEENEALLQQRRELREQQQQQRNNNNNNGQRQRQAVHIQIDMPDLMERAQQAFFGHLPDFLQGAEEALGLAEEAFGHVGEAIARAEMDMNQAQEGGAQRQPEGNNNNNNPGGGLPPNIFPGLPPGLFGAGAGAGGQHHEAFVIGGGVIPLMGGFGEGVFMRPPHPIFFQAGNRNNNNNPPPPPNNNNNANGDNSD